MEGLKINSTYESGERLGVKYSLDGEPFDILLAPTDGQQLDMSEIVDHVMREHNKREEANYIDPSTRYKADTLAELMGCSVWTITRYARAGLLSRRNASDGEGFVYSVLGWVRLEDLRNKSARKETLKALAQKVGVELEGATQTKVIPMTHVEEQVADIFTRRGRTITQKAAERIVKAARKEELSDEEIFNFVAFKLNDILERGSYATTAIVSFICADVRQWKDSKTPQPVQRRTRRQEYENRRAFDDMDERRSDMLQASNAVKCQWFAIRSFFAVVRSGEHLVESKQLIRRDEYDNATIAVYKVTSASFKTGAGLSARTQVELAINDSKRNDASVDRALAVAYMRKVVTDQAKRADEWSRLHETAKSEVLSSIDRLITAWMDI